MKIGGAWIQKKDDKTYMTATIELPLLGKLRFAMFKNEKKQGNHPDYNIEWRADKAGDSEHIGQDSIPF